MSYSIYVPKHERPVLSALLTMALKDDNTVSLCDGEEWVVKRSTSINEVRTEMGAAEEDTLVIRNVFGDKLGFFYLIYDNGSEGEPMVVIADYQANEYCESIYRELASKYDQ
jgi:predicted fused transcriptional regulator/phosphomethylpyrimidine kinase